MIVSLTSIEDSLTAEPPEALHTLIQEITLHHVHLVDSDFGKSDPGEAIVELNMLILCEFIRLEFDSRFSLNEPQPKLRKHIRLHATLWSKTFRLMERMGTIGWRHQEKHPLTLFPALCTERHGLITPHLGSLSEDDRSLSRFVNIGQAQTQRLRDKGLVDTLKSKEKTVSALDQKLQKLSPVVNGVSHKSAFETGSVSQIIEHGAIELCEKFNQFGPNFYTPFLNARAALVLDIKNSRPTAITHVAPENRGRKKKAKKKGVS